MCFYRKKFKQIQQKLDDLTNIIKTQELIKLREESKELKEVRHLLDLVKLEVDFKKTILMENEDGTGYSLNIVYKQPVVKLPIDYDGNVQKNDLFYALNMLEITNQNSQEKLVNKINSIVSDIKSKNK